MSEPTAAEPNIDRVATLFAEVLHLPADQRRRALARAAAESPELAAEVESLLAAHARSEDWLAEQIPEQFAELLSDDVEDDATGRRIGPYRLSRAIGHGGMGSVFLAERAEGGFEQRVAIKVIKRGMDSEAILERFLLERQILARLEHPGIARLLDGGLTDGGQPYFAIEYVEGEPITKYCDTHRLTLRDRLALFTQVCSAVHYAHGQLIIHRDLKPANILVTREGEVKLLDFGIAKLLGEGDQSNETELTRLGMRPLTPEYAAPEQLRGEPVTVAADVFALGIVLYELLAGRRPRFDGSETNELTRAPIERPSTAVVRSTPTGSTPGHGDGQTPEAIAACRRTRLDRLRKRLRGDLDTIVLQALRPEPQRRYSSVDRLLQDVQRHLAGLPVAARDDTLAYRVDKFVRRNVVAVTAATLVMVSLLAGLTGMLWQTRVATLERDRARAAQDYLVSIFRAAAPEVAQGETVTAQQLLDRGVERIAEELESQPAVHLEMLLVLSEVQEDLGRFEQSALLAERALMLARQLNGDDHPSTIKALRILGKARLELGESQKAEALLRVAVETGRRVLGSDHDEFAVALNHLANVLQNLDRFDESEALFREALQLRQRLHGNADQRTAASLNNYGLMLRDRGRYEEAEALFRESLATWSRAGIEVHPGVGATLTNLALAVEGLGQYSEANEFLAASLEIQEKVYGEQHPFLGATLYNIARMLEKGGNYSEAAEAFRNVLELDRKVLGEDHHYVGLDLSRLAEALAEAGELEEAAEASQAGIDIIAARLGTEDSAYGAALARHAIILHYQGQHERALPMLERALATLRIKRGPDHPDVAVYLGDLGSILNAVGEPEKAVSTYRAALEIQRTRLPESHPQMAEVLTGLGQVLVASGRLTEAEPVLVEAAAMSDATLPPGHPKRMLAHRVLNECRQALGNASDQAIGAETGT